MVTSTHTFTAARVSGTVTSTRLPVPSLSCAEVSPSMSSDWSVDSVRLVSCDVTATISASSERLGHEASSSGKEALPSSPSR